MFKIFSPAWVITNLFTLSFGGSSAPAPTTTTVQNTNIPDYAQPYVMNMLGATENQLFNTDSSGNISGFQAYNPYSTDPSNYVAGFSPLQQQAQNTAAGMQMPGQYGQASGLAGASGMGSMGIAGQASQAGNNYANQATNPYATQAYMNPYLQNSLQPQLNEISRQYGITGAQEMGNATQQGAMGGSREALMAAENNRNMNTAMNQAIGNGYNNAFQAAQQAQQFGANLGLQGQQTALTGLGQANTAAGTLGQLGTAQEAAQQGIINTQSTMGQQQQTQQQNITNQAIQNYANAQQYPMMQLGMMSNMLRGLPMQGMTTQQYAAQPSMTNQLVGLTGALANTAQTKTAKAGGIMEAERFDVGGAVKADISKLPTDKLQAMMSSTPSPIVKGDIRAELGLRAQGVSQDFAKGGILSFAEGTPDPRDEKYLVPTDLSEIPMPAHAKSTGTAKGEVNPSSRFSGPTDVPVGSTDVPVGSTGSAQPTYTPKPLPYVQAQIAKEAAAKAIAKQEVPAAVTEKPAPAQAAPKAGVLAADTLHRPTSAEMETQAMAELSPDQRAAITGETKVPDVGSFISQQKSLEDKFMDPALAAARRADRAEAMATKSNIKEELAHREQVEKQNMWLRIGSTPGPLLAVGLKSMLEKNAADLQNTQWGKDATKDANALITKFNDSDYMIQQGDIAEGYKLHEQSVKDLKSLLDSAEKHKDASKTLMSSMYGHDVARADAVDAQRTRKAQLDIERQKVALLPNKFDDAKNKNWATVYDTVYKTEAALNPATASDKAVAAANLAIQTGTRVSPTAGSMVIDPKTGVKTWQLPK